MLDRNYKFRLRFLLQEIDLQEGVFVIGRSPSCNLTLKDPLVSRRHARITIFPDHASLDDLGSRNGTLVNGEPIFENQRLWHSDNIRIGAHTLGFVRERQYPVSKSVFLDEGVSCPECGELFKEGTSSCPGCATPLIPDDFCRHCHAQIIGEAKYCPKCGTPIGRDDSTIPVELGGERSGWTPEIIDGVINKALTAGRFEQAARLLDGRIEDFEKNLRQKDADLEELTILSGFNLNVAKELKNPNRLSWVVQNWSEAPSPMPFSIVKNLEIAASDWYDITVELWDYLAQIESRSGEKAIDPDLIELLREAIGNLH